MSKISWFLSSESIICVLFVYHFYVLTTEPSIISAKKHIWWTTKEKDGIVEEENEAKTVNVGCSKYVT